MDMKGYLADLQLPPVTKMDIKDDIFVGKEIMIETTMVDAGRIVDVGVQASPFRAPTVENKD